MLGIKAIKRVCVWPVFPELGRLLLVQLSPVSAWLGLTPREHSSGGKQMLGGISKRGDGYTRKLLVHGARAVVRMRSRKSAEPMPWLDGLLERKHRNAATVALAHKNARVVWALLNTGKVFDKGASQVQMA